MVGLASRRLAQQDHYAIGVEGADGDSVGVRRYEPIEVLPRRFQKGRGLFGAPIVKDQRQVPNPIDAGRENTKLGGAAGCVGQASAARGPGIL